MTETSSENGRSGYRLLLQTLEPVHVGTGAYRLGRVDMPIVREPGTRIPKIPGTSLHGAARTYAAYANETPRCAGAGVGEDKHCGAEDCPICYTFGYIKDEAGGNSGTVSIGDALLLFFPVYSAAGTIWVTSDRVLADFGISVTVGNARVKLGAGISNRAWLNLGWLMLESDGSFDSTGLPEDIPKPVKERCVVVTDELFSRVVNSNLEIRTSVAISPETGAAEDQALFTYEAIPRAAWLWMEVVEDRARRQPFAPHNGWTRPLDVVETGLRWMELLGVGGMGTRGFGRLRHRRIAEWHLS